MSADDECALIISDFVTDTSKTDIEREPNNGGVLRPLHHQHCRQQSEFTAGHRTCRSGCLSDEQIADLRLSSIKSSEL